MKRRIIARHGRAKGVVAAITTVLTLAGATDPASAGSHIPGIGPGTRVDVYIPNPDAPPPIAWAQGTEPPPPQGDYGGGFLQYMITGNETRPVPTPRVPPPYYPQVVAPLQSARGYRTGRYAPDFATHARPPGDTAAPQGYRRGAYGPYSANSPVPGTAPAAFAPAGYAPVAYAWGGTAAPADQTPGSAAAYRQVAYTQPDAVAFSNLGQPVEASIDPMYRRQEIGYAGPQGAGTIVIDTSNKFLYLVEGGGRALRYGIGVGRPGFLWAGSKTITRKAEWPDWTPPSEMLARRPDLPRHMDGGMANPLGARALYLGASMYRIHGTNEPDTIGTNVSSGCIRLLNDDVADLYARVRVGTRVIVM